MIVCDWGQFWGVLVGIYNEQFKLLMKMSSLSYRWIEQSAMCKILVSAPVPIGHWD